MPVPLDVVIRAACGDAQALADIARAPDHNCDAVDRLTAFALCDPAPHPLAALTALAAQARPPDALRAVARRALPAAAALLGQNACADLRAALAPHLSRVWNALADPSDRESIAACARLAPAMNAAAVAALLERIGAEGWKQTPPEARGTLLQAIGADPHAAARGGGKVWAALDPQECVHIAQIAAQGGSAVTLLASIGAEGWTLAPPAARAALLQAIETEPEEAGIGGGLVWEKLAPDERRRIALRVAGDDRSAADLLECIGAAGWTLAPPETRETLLHAIRADPRAAARGGGAVWAALEPAARRRIAQRAADDAQTAAFLLERIGAEGWTLAPPEAQETLLQAICNDRKSAARAGGAVWTALDDKARARIAQAAGDDRSAADLLARIGPEGWTLTPPEAQETLLQAIETEPEEAGIGGGLVWEKLAPDERRRIALRVAGDDRSAADLLERIGPEGWTLTPPAARETLLQALDADPYAAARGGGAVWAALEPVARARIAQIAAQDASAAAVLLERIGAEGWRLAPPAARAALLQAIDADSQAAARGGGKVWRALDDQARACIVISAAGDAWSAADLLARVGPDGWKRTPPEARETLLGAAARDPHAAVRALLILGDAPDDGARMRLLRAAAPGDDGSRAVAQALSEGAAWRDWMDAFVPDRNASGEAIARWRAVAHRLPAVVAARLPVSRRQRR